MERFVILGALLIGVNAGPLPYTGLTNIDTTCSKTCLASTKFNYIPGKTYQFNYDTEVQTSVQGSSDNYAGVHMSATVHIEVLTKCELVLRLTDVSLEEYDPNELIMKKTASADFSRSLEKYPLRISFQDGSINELCQVAEEPQWVMNVKRGILSVFQSNFVDGQGNSTLTETDIAGSCATDYTHEDGWYSKTVKKSKNLLSCTERNGYNTVIQGVPYTSDSNIQSLPIVKSTHECEHQIDKQLHHLTSATCREQHVFRPFSRGDSGAVTSSTQKLQLIKQTQGTRPTSSVLKRTSLKFEHTASENQETKTRKELERKLLEVCEGTKSGVSSETPRLFSDLVYLVRMVDSRTLSETYKRIQEGAVCSENKDRVSKFLLDALPIAGTSASLNMMTDLLTKKIVTGLEASMWITSLAFIKNPTQDMLSQVKPLLTLEDNEDKAMLSVGSLVHSYCTSVWDCEQDTVVKKIIATMESKIVRGCKVNKNDVKSTLIALRAIGNAGFAYGAVPTLTACMTYSTNPTEIRLSAIQAFRRMPCDASVDLMSLFLDTNEDSEIRIAAYKALMECPSEAVIDRVKTTLESEEVNQVGSYVWSHLSNLMETSDRHKQYVREILEDQNLQKEFNLDKRKFSHNYEGSFFLEKLNTGAKVEGDLIWSQKSFLPRSAMLNLTVDLFGHSVNFLELGGRAEGLEFFMESFFGPNGYFSENMPDDETVDISRSKDLHPTKMRKLDSRYKPRLDDLKAAMYMRVFGNELCYMDIQGLDGLLSGPNLNILEMVTQLSKDNDYTMTHSMMFLDSSMIIPTGSGFPMNLTVNGTATMDLKLKGKMDFKSLPTVDINGLIQPSAAIDISSMMSVDAYVTRSGIKMVSTLHTNTAVQGSLKISRDGVITAEYEIPQPRMDIISVKSSFFSLHNHQEKEQKMITENQQRSALCSSNKLVTITGLELCGEITYPNASLKSDAPYFPLTGPVTAGVFLYNRDTHRKYKMVARSLHNPKSSIIHFDFDTPESKIDRHVSVDINMDKRANILDMTLTSPWKKATFQGALTLDRFTKGISGKMNIDGDKSYTLNAQMKKERVKNAHKYSPSIEITLPNKQPYTVSGMFMYDGIRKFDVELDMNRITAKPVKASGTLFNKPNLIGVKGKLVLSAKDTYTVDISNSIQPFKAKTVYKPLISIRTPTQEVVAFGGNAQYIYGKKFAYNFVLDKIVAKKITLKGFMQKLVRNRNRILYRNKINFASSPMDFSLDAKLDNRNYKTIATDIALTYIVRRLARNSIKLVSKVNNLSSRALLKGKSSLLFTVKRNPELNVKMIGNIDHNKKHTDADLDLRYGADFKDDNKHLEFNLASNRVVKSLTDVSADGQVRLRHAGQGVNVMLKGNHKHDATNLDSEVMMRFGKGEPIESSLHLSDRTTQLLDVSGLFTLNYPGRQIVINETIRQPEEFKYISDFNGQFQKGQKNSIVTSFTQKSPFIGRIDADVHMHEDKPYQVDVEWSTEPTEFYTRGSFQKGINRYAGSLTSVNVPDLYRVVTEVEVPQRHMKLALEGKPMADLWSGIAELDLNVDKQNSERVTLSSWLEPVTTPKRINGSISLTYPQRTLTLNAHNIIGSKVTSHADFSWEKNKQIDADFIYGSGDTGKSKQIVSKVKVTTPFEMMKSVSVDLTHADASEEYKTMLDLRWQPHSIATTTIIRKPLSFRTIVGSIETSTSFKEARKIRFDINHKLSDSLASAAKLSWNKMFVQTEITLVNQSKPSKTAYKGDINIKTSFPVMKKGVFSFSHSNNGMTFTTSADFLRNRKKYGISSEITHQTSYPGVRNTGSITLFCPYGKSVTDWSHRNSENDIATVFSTKWGDGKKLTQEIFFKTNGNMFMEDYSGSVNGSVELLTPFSALSDIKVELSHVHEGMKYYGNKPFLDSTLRVLKDQRNIASLEVYRKAASRELTSYILLMIPDLDVDSSFKVLMRDPKEPEDDADAIVSFELNISPNIAGSLVLKAMLDKAFHSAIEFKSTHPDCKYFTYTYDAQIDKFMKEDQLSVVRRLHYGDGKIIEIGTKLVLDNELMRGFLEIKTPYDSLQHFEGDVVFTADDMKNIGSFTWDSYLEVLPHIQRTSQSVLWNTRKGLEGKLKVDTPFKELSMLEANVNLEERNKFIQGSVGLDYSSTVLPHHPVQIDVSSDYLNYDMSAKMSTPFYIDLSHKGNLDNFNCKAEFGLQPGRKDFGLDLGFKNLDKLEGSVTVSIPSRRDISGYFSHSGTVASFVTHAEILHNRKNQLLSDFSFNTNGDLSLTTSASLKSDILQLPDEYEFEFRHEGWPRNFKTHAEFSTMNLGKTEGDVSFDSRNDIQGSIQLKSPNMRDIFSSFNLHTRSDYVQVRADYSYGSKKEIDFLATVDTSNVFSGEVSLTSPFSREVKALARVTGQIDNFMAYSELFHGSDKSEVDISFGFKPKLRGSFSLKTPYMTDISSEFDHTGTFPNTKTEAKLGYNGKDQFKIVTSLSTKGKLIGTVSVDTPFTDFETMKLEASHEGQLKNFRCHGEFVINTDKTEADIFYSSLGKYEGLASLKSHLFQDLSVGFEHSGTSTSFKSHVEYTIGFVKTEGDISLDIGDDIDASLTVRSPNFNEHQITYKHKGTYNDFSCHAVYSHGFDRKEMTLKVANKDIPKLDFTITAPELTLNLNHAGHVSNFQSHGDIMFDGEKRVADILLRISDKVVGSVTVTAPMFSLKISQDGDLLNFVSNIEAVKDYDRYASEARLSTKNGIDANVQLNSPIEGYESIKAQYVHDGSFKNLNFKCHGELSIPDSVSTAVLKVNLETAFEGSFSLSSPLIPEITAEFDHSRTATMYKSHAEVSIDQDVIAGITMSIDHSAGLSGDILVQTPFIGFRNIRSTGRYTGNLESFSLHHEVSMGMDRVSEIDVNFDSKPKHAGSLSIKTPLLPEINADFNFAGQPSKFGGNTKVLIDGIKKIGVSGSVNVIGSVNVDFDIVTPIENFTRIEGQFNLMDKLNYMEHDAQFSIEGRIIVKTDAQLTINDKITASGAIESVFFEPVRVNGEYQGLIKDLKSSTEIFHNNEKWAGIKLSNNGEFPDIRSSIKLSYGSDDYSLSTDLSNKDKTSGKMTIILPIQDWENTEISFSHEGSLPNVKTSVKIDFASGTDIEINTEHDKVGLTDMYKFYLMSPYTDEIDMSFNHTGGVSFNFDNSFELRISKDIKINSENSLKTGPDYITYSYINKALMSGETFTQKITFNHHGNLANFKTDALVSYMDKFVQMGTSFQMKPVLTGSVSLQSSIETVKDIKAGFSHNENQNGFVTTGEVQYSPDNKIEGKVDFTNYGWRRMVTDIELRTPFKGYDLNRISYEHKGDSDSFQCDGEILVGEKKVTGTITGSKAPWSLGINVHTPFENFEKLAFNGNVEIDHRGRYSSRVETSWNPADILVIDGTLTALNRNQLVEGSLSVSSPFEALNKLNVDFTHRELSDKYMESLKVGYNGQNLVDVELDDSLFQTRKTAALIVRSPRPMKFEIDGEFSLESSNAELTANWNSDNPSSNLNIVAGYDFRPRMSDKTINFRLTGLDQKITYSGSLDMENKHTKSDLTWGDNSDQKIGYDITLKQTDTRAKIILPTRSIELTGSNRGRITEGSVMWDADNDQMKKVGFRSIIVPSADAVKADVTLMLPSLGKNVQVDSEMILNRGRVIFDAKTELSYSPDSRKKLVIMSKLEDISSWGSKNYSLSLGLSHPYSTMDVKMDSHVGESDSRLTGSVGLEYMTARRQTKTFQVSGQIDKLRKTVSFELVSPLKTISISGSTDNSDKFRVSLLNVYDHRQPLNTVLTVDPLKKTISLVMNYDEDYPANELQLTAGYVNSSAVSAEIFHVIRGVKVTDVLIAVRLNNSQLLHNRLHWRPELLQDLKAHMERKSSNYKQRLNKAIETISINLDNEIIHKSPLIRDSLEELIGEMAVNKIDEVVSPVLVAMLDGVNDVTVDVIRLLSENIRHIANKTSVAYNIVNPADKLGGIYTGLSNSSALKYARMLRLANQPLSSQASYVVDMFRDQIQAIPSSIGNTMKYTVGGMLPNTISQHVTNANKYWELEDNFGHMTNSILDLAGSEVMDQLRSLEHDLIKAATLPNYIYDPTHGEIQVDLHLPIPLKSLDTLPEVPELKSFALGRNVHNLINMVPMLGGLDDYVPDLTGELMPPFKAYASVKNGHKITTFDGYDYDLSLDCTFVLAKDFMDGNFSLILNNDGETSLTVLAKGKQISLTLSGEVSINGQQIDLPYSYKNLTVTSPVDGLIIVDGADNFKVTWDTAEDHIQVTINGWYHGKTGGLLGIYDNEPSNDLMTPFRKVIDNSRRFAATWDVGRTNCR